MSSCSLSENDPDCLGAYRLGCCPHKFLDDGGPVDFSLQISGIAFLLEILLTVDGLLVDWVVFAAGQELRIVVGFVAGGRRNLEEVSSSGTGGLPLLQL